MNRTGCKNECSCVGRLKLVCLSVVIIIIVCAFIRYHRDEIDYLNSDATWHALLTIKAYNETPVSEHLFLPLVSLGQEGDKWIPWGATVPDANGNYYYTSFSPAGYFLPWLFIKIFRLSVSEKSLYIFNTVLFVLSAVLWVWLLSLVYKESEYKNMLCLIGGLAYAGLPELLHGMGIVYWHQSILQVTLLLQIVMYYEYAVKSSKKCGYIFYTLALINPYIEWTGYVANVGFALAEMMRLWSENWKKAVYKAAKLGVVTTASFAVFSVHYLTRLDVKKFFEALKNRFMARNVTTNVTLTDVFGGYYKSFLFLWVLLLIFVIWSYVRNKDLKISNGLLILVMSFPVLENIIMKQHALAYTYDRMKAAFVLVFLLCETARNILESSKKEKVDGAALGILTVLCMLLNIYSYVGDTKYIWPVDYRNNNSILADEVAEKYPDAVYASGATIRGYMNLLFGRGIYECTSFDRAVEIAGEKGKGAVVYITKDGYRLTDVAVYLMNTAEHIKYTVSDLVVLEENVDEEIHLADLTDGNWEFGCSRTSNTILFNRTDDLLIQLLSHSQIGANGENYSILNVDYDDLWIRVELDKDTKVCMYPAIITIE